MSLGNEPTMEATMTNEQPGSATALDLAMAYHRAWTSHDVEAALRLVADDVVCDAPGGTLRGMDQYRPFLSNFAPSVTGYEMIASLGDRTTAVLVYDLHTRQVPSGLICECFTVEHDRITRNRLIFDQVPYLAARQQTS
jgi:limonene-1,2-epoxide hydrolase